MVVLQQGFPEVSKRMLSRAPSSAHLTSQIFLQLQLTHSAQTRVSETFLCCGGYTNVMPGENMTEFYSGS